MLDVYTGICEFKKRDGVIIKQFGLYTFSNKVGALYETPHGRTFMVVDASEPLEEKIKIIIHELLHLSPKYIIYYGPGKSSEDVENRINTDTELVYRNLPLLRNYLKTKYSQSKVNPFMFKHTELEQDVDAGLYGRF